MGLFYGQRALAIGALHPVNYTGTSQSTGGRERPFRRLVRTANDFETIFFGTRAEADRVLGEGQQAARARAAASCRGRRAVPRRHAVLGVRPRADAVDGRPSRRLGAVLLRAVRAAAERLGARRASGRTTCASASCSGCRATVAPPTYAAFRAWWDAKLRGRRDAPDRRGALHGRVRRVRDPDAARSTSRPSGVHDLDMLGSLPPRVRELYGLSWSPRQARAFPLAVAALRGLRSGRAARRSRRAAARAASRSWRRPSGGRIERGKPTPQLPPLPAARGRAGRAQASAARRARRRASRASRPAPRRARSRPRAARRRSAR